MNATSSENENANTSVAYAESIIHYALTELKKIKKIKAAYIFGSYATGRQLPFSDIDICIIADELTETEKSEISGLNSDKIQISIFRELPVYIRFRVLKEGRMLFCRNEAFLHRVISSTLKEYFAFRHILSRMKVHYGERHG